MMPQPCMAVSEFCNFCSSIVLCHLQSTWKVKLKSQKPCTPVFSSTVISARGWQAQHINLNWNSWNYAFQKESMILLQEIIFCGSERGKKGEFREQSSLTSGQKEKNEWWVFIRGLCNVPSHENCLNQHHGCKSVQLWGESLPSSSVWHGLSSTIHLPEAIISLMNHSSNLETQCQRC